MPARDYFLGLSDGDKSKVLSLFRYLANAGYIPNREKFRKLGRYHEENVYELKSFQIRLLGSYRGPRFLVALGVQKQKPKHRPEDIERAVQILTENDSREGPPTKPGRRGAK